MTQSTRMGLDMRLRPGTGVLTRQNDLVLLCEMTPDAEDHVRSILKEVKNAAKADQPGRHLVRTLVKSLAASGDKFPSLCAFGAVEDGIAVAVHGKARLKVTMTDGELELDGKDAVTIVDRVVAGAVTSITGEIGEQVLKFCPWSELTEGVVRADAMQYGSFDDLFGDVPMAETDMADMAAVVTEAPAEVPAQVDAESAVESTVEPAAAEAADEAPAEEEEDASQVVGVSCAKGHFNDPGDPYCAVCGIGLTQAGRRSARKERPPLGVLVLDDGMSLPMTKDYVIGREPQNDSDMDTSEVMLLRLADPLVSGVHARVQRQGWDVELVDVGSANGTFVRESGSDFCLRVPPGGKVTLRPGAIVTVGSRQFRYDSYRRPVS